MALTLHDEVVPGRPPAALDRRFEAIAFDWDGTAVDGRQSDASRLRQLVEELCSRGLHLAVVSGTDVHELDAQLQARPEGPGHLYLCVGRGSEVYRAGVGGLRLVHRREATAEEAAALTAAADRTLAALADRGVPATLVPQSQLGTRRTIGLLPGPERGDRPETRRGVDERLRAAGLAGLRDVVAVAERAALDAGLPEVRVSGDTRHAEIGLTDESDASRWLVTELEGLGVGPGLLLVVGDEFGAVGGLPGSDSRLLVREAARATAASVGPEPSGTPGGVIALGGGPDRFRALLVDQLERRRRGDVPELDRDPAWTLAVDGVDPRLERVHESLLTLGDGTLGTRGAPLFDHPAAEPGVVAAGRYVGEGPETALAECPPWATLEGQLPAGASVRRELDLRTGLLREEGPAVALRFSSLARPGTVALRAAADPALLPQPGQRTVITPSITLALADDRRDGRLDRLGAYRADEAEALGALADAETLGFDGLLAEHREAWAERWRGSDIVIEGDSELQHAVRVALFHLIGSVADEGEAAVGARGLSGSGYRGHVFWDSDVFVLPFLAATHPAAARAMLEYRLRRLPAAREAARRLGLAGARFPWEGADGGFDVTPSLAHLPSGEVARIRTGEAEEHIVADVAWAAACYLDWTGDEAFAAGPAQELLTETARYWASRIRVDGTGRGHLLGVIGPDEYHEPVDDNAFTNVMARWNLRRAAALDGQEGEREEWLRLADSLVDGYDRMSGLYEQFAGFFRLEPLVIADVSPRRPIAADLLLGPERTRGAQVLKQADVLMLHHLLPDEVAPGSLLPNLDFYEPRTAHGSSLSPAIHAALLARAGRFRDAVAALRTAARIDLDDLTGSTASGLHLATMGGLWQALVFGFAGVRPRGDSLVVDPRLPPGWGALELALRFRGSPLRLRIDRGGVSLAAGPELSLRSRDHSWEVVRS